MKRILYTVALMITAYCSSGQENEFSRQPDAGIFKEVSKLGWIKFQDSYKIQPERVFEVNKAAFGLVAGFGMRISKNDSDQYGYKHVRFQETYNGIDVLGGEYYIHAKNGTSFTGNGKILTTPSVKSSRIISEADALSYALININAKSYYWQDPKRQRRLQAKKGLAATYYPPAKFAYVLSPDSSTLLLCYSFEIHTKEFGKSAICYVDASSGLIIEKKMLDSRCDATTIVTTWYGVQGISTNEVGVIDDSYDLEDDCQSSVYSVYDATDDDDIFNTDDNNWVTDRLRSAATSLWSIKESYIWFDSFFGRTGHDGDDQNLEIYQGYNFGGSTPGDNAAYSYDEFGDDQIKVGEGMTNSIQDDYNALDILAHEFTHGVTHYTAGLDGNRDPGALNESFSDIFGEWIEYKKFGGNNWIIGFDRDKTNCNRIMRNLADPSAQNVDVGCGALFNFSDPNTYLTPSNWIASNNPTDNYGIHTNCGVQNQVFYLLSLGGSGWNNGQTCHAPVNSGFSWSVSGISIDNAARIAYKALTSYLTNGSTYPDARNAWVQAAENIFGTCSYEAIQTGKAWAAVGIGPPIQQTVELCNEAYGAAPYTLLTPKNISTKPLCSVTILATGNLIEFRAGYQVFLNPGFKAFAGSRFRASVVSDCSFAQY